MKHFYCREKLFAANADPSFAVTREPAKRTGSVIHIIHALENAKQKRVIRNQLKKTLWKNWFSKKPLQCCGSLGSLKKLQIRR